MFKLFAWLSLCIIYIYRQKGYLQGFIVNNVIKWQSPTSFFSIFTFIGRKVDYMVNYWYNLHLYVAVFTVPFQTITSKKTKIEWNVTFMAGKSIKTSVIFCLWFSIPIHCNVNHFLLCNLVKPLLGIIFISLWFLHWIQPLLIYIKSFLSYTPT